MMENITSMFLKNFENDPYQTYSAHICAWLCGLKYTSVNLN